MNALRLFASLLVLLAFAACTRDVQPLPQQVYIWQRSWSPAHAIALDRSHELFGGLRVLAAQLHPREGLVRARVDLDMLRGDARPVIVVLRIDGEWMSVDSTQVSALAAMLVAEWRAAGIAVKGLEIDYDCATAKLAAYTVLLRDLRATLPVDLGLSITVLPTWIGSTQLVELLAATDHAVLQVHAVEASKRGLFDAKRAQQWIDGFSHVSPVPFWVSLPAYGAALVELDAGQVLVESETTIPRSGERIEIGADPQAVADLLRALERSPRHGLAGLVWFRLPLEGDLRVWSLPTLAAVIEDVPLRAGTEAGLRQSGAAQDLFVRNAGTLDAALPTEIVVTAPSCEAGDALAGYTLERSGQRWRFLRNTSARLPAEAERVVGWLRCAQIGEGTIDVVAGES